MPLFRALANNMAPMTNADESPTNRLTLFPIYLSFLVVSSLCRRRPEVNQAVVDGVSRSCLKSQTAVEKASRS